MLPQKADPIAMVEACYDLRVPEETWLQNLAQQAFPMMQVDTVLAYHLDIDETGWHLSSAVQAGDGAGDVAGIITRIGTAFDRIRDGSATDEDHGFATGYQQAANEHWAQPVDQMLLSELDTRGQREQYTLGLDLVDLHFLLNHHIDGGGTTYIAGRLLRRGQLRSADRTMWLRLGAHVKAGLRLRRRLVTPPGASVAAPIDGAILDPLGRIVHAEGEASDTEARRMLGQLTRDVDRARTARTGRDAAALAIWEGLVDGRWSLVEQFDSDGRRFVLAHKNPEGVTDPRGLTELESRIARLAARGYADKLVAYHLGIAEGTASSQLARAIRKLGVSGRTELARLFGSPPVASDDSPTEPSS